MLTVYSVSDPRQKGGVKVVSDEQRMFNEVESDGLVYSFELSSEVASKLFRFVHLSL